MFGGRITPGSGNKYIKGDVITKSGWRVEVKQTEKPKINVLGSWFKKLLKYHGQNELALCIYFELRPYIYILFGTENDPHLVKGSSTFSENDLPNQIKYENTIWTKVTKEELKNYL